MRYRVTWTIEVDAADDRQAHDAARQYLLDNEDAALAKIVPIDKGSTPHDVPRVEASDG